MNHILRRATHGGRPREAEVSIVHEDSLWIEIREDEHLDRRAAFARESVLDTQLDRELLVRVDPEDLGANDQDLGAT